MSSTTFTQYLHFSSTDSSHGWTTRSCSTWGVDTIRHNGQANTRSCINWSAQALQIMWPQPEHCALRCWEHSLHFITTLATPTPPPKRQWTYLRRRTGSTVVWGKWDIHVYHLYLQIGVQSCSASYIPDTLALLDQRTHDTATDRTRTREADRAACCMHGMTWRTANNSRCWMIKAFKNRVKIMLFLMVVKALKCQK